MKPFKTEPAAAAARENRIEGLMAVAGFSAVIAYFIGREGAPLSLYGGLYGAAVVAVFFAVLYLLGAAIMIGSCVVWRFGKGAWRNGAARQADDHSETATLHQQIDAIADEIEIIKGSCAALLSVASQDTNRLGEMHAAFKTAQAERQRR